MNLLTTLTSDPAVLTLAEGVDWSSGILAPISAAMKLVAVLVVIGAAIKSVKDIMSGKIGDAAKVIIGAVILVVFLWRPDLIELIINAFTGIAESGIESVDGFTTEK